VDKKKKMKYLEEIEKKEY